MAQARGEQGRLRRRRRKAGRVLAPASTATPSCIASTPVAASAPSIVAAKHCGADGAREDRAQLAHEGHDLWLLDPAVGGGRGPGRALGGPDRRHGHRAAGRRLVAGVERAEHHVGELNGRVATAAEQRQGLAVGQRTDLVVDAGPVPVKKASMVSSAAGRRAGPCRGRRSG